MHRHVTGEMKLAFERPTAVRAVVRSLPGVDPHVNRKRCLGGEPFATFAADVRLVFGVTLHVDLQLLAGQEHLATDVAEVQALSVRVNLLVLSQRPNELETAPADPTAMRSFSSMGHLVAGQRSEVAEGFTAHAAQVQLPAGVSPAVSC